MAEQRTIKKYPNRRLYDTEESRYITLADVRQLVIDKVDFRVIDKQTDADITQQILLQVIAEQQEQHGEAVLSRELLAAVIRAYGDQMQNVVGRYLDQSMKLFSTQQRELRERVKGALGQVPVDAVQQLAQKNYQRFRALQDEVFRTLAGPVAKFRREREIDDDLP